MNYLKTIILIIWCVKAEALHAQDLSSHQWKDRLLLVFVDHTVTDTYQNQMAIFEKAAEGLKARKLIVYQIKPSAIKVGLDQPHWQKLENPLHQYKKTTAPFEVVLIGLDGKVKWRQTVLLSRKKLFAVIDAMPMRSAEINAKKKHK